MKQNRILSFLLVIIMALIAFQANAQNTELDVEQFTTKISGEKVLINWSVSASGETNYFEIQKSKNGKDFKTIAYVMGPDPSKEGNQFGYFDLIERGSRKTHYRLKHVATNGESYFSEIQTVQTK